ncbi:MAG TPA: Na+/H+ antiporter subunit E [Methanocorpusculum sp.]|nr:Na+/H+ antiporter subunit E [Methanocorpusculum sp.]
MSRFAAGCMAALAAFIAYLALSAGSAIETSTILLWSLPELIIGLLLALLTGFLCRKFIPDTAARFFNPRRWLFALVYLPLFAVEFVIANCKTAWSVISGRNIRPAIVKVKTPMKNDAGTLLLSATITYQPGTAVVESDETDRSLYIHMLDAGEKPEKTVSEDKIFAKISLAKWLKKVTE